MKIKNFWIAISFVFIAVLLSFQSVFAHESVTVGNYEIEYGWLNEPVIFGEVNAFIVNISDTSGSNPQPVEDVSALTVTVSYGGQNKVLTLQPSGVDTPGQFVVPILPTTPGQYTLIFGGKLGDTDVSAAVEPEEVGTADALQFPNVEVTQQGIGLGLTNMLIYLSMLIGITALILAVIALRKKR